MELDEFQQQARLTVQKASTEAAVSIVPILGLAGEVGELVNEFKKYLRDGAAHVRFRDRLAEELGDVLWYVADTATKFELSLSEIAEQNLVKTRARWGFADGSAAPALPGPHVFDKGFPEYERFPRRFVAVFEQVDEGGMRKVRVMVENRQLGEDLTDNAHQADGYRFHDVFHLACAAVLGWSPVTRRNFPFGPEAKGIKRKSNVIIDEVEDGGRAIVTEEGISALVFAYAVDHASLEGVSHVDYDLLKSIRVLTAKFEVSVCTAGEWEAAILMGYRVWKQLEREHGGTVEVDLDNRCIRFLEKRSPDQDVAFSQ
jgi:NTP pyrophosphatase (non-canonical NTP hydrolase)